MKIGDCVQSSIWITGDEDHSLRKRYELDVIEAIDYFCSEQGFQHGPVTFIENTPGDAGVPEVPDHIQGSRVRLLIAESTVFSVEVKSSEGSFIANLDKNDLSKLRIITRRAWLKIYPREVLSDRQCDDYIEELGPEAALDTLRRNHNSYN